MKNGFFKYFSDNGEGLFIFFLSIAAIIFLAQWAAWVFSLGRFKKLELTSEDSGSGIRYIFADLLVKIVNEFRHLLALIIVFIFAFALAYTLWQAGGKISDIRDGLQVVVSTLGGLVGSIIGYYFGEYAGLRGQREDVAPGVSVDTVEQNLHGFSTARSLEEDDQEEPIEKAPSPPTSPKSPPEKK